MSERKNDPQMRVVSAEGIEEFKVQSSAYSAEFGRASNGVLNYTTKSGTNEFHGTAFGVIRNQALNALGFFYTAPIVPKPVVHNQNLEAASFGGPVRIPKLFDLRNKVFFFLSGERSRAKDISNSGLISLPPAAFRNGRFPRPDRFERRCHSALRSFRCQRQPDQPTRLSDSGFPATACST